MVWLKADTGVYSISITVMLWFGNTTGVKNKPTKKNCIHVQQGVASNSCMLIWVQIKLTIFGHIMKHLKETPKVQFMLHVHVHVGTTVC